MNRCYFWAFEGRFKILIRNHRKVEDAYEYLVAVYYTTNYRRCVWRVSVRIIIAQKRQELPIDGGGGFMNNDERYINQQFPFLISLAALQLIPC